MLCQPEKIAESCGSVKKYVLGSDASNCNFGYWKTWPFSYLNSSSSICDEFLRIYPEYALQITIDQRLEEFISNILKRPDITFTKYEGYVQYAFLGLMFLMQRNPEECVIMSNLDQTVQRIWNMKDKSLEFIDWSDIGLVWQPHTISKRFRLHYPGGKDNYIRAAKECNNKKSGRFLLSILTLINTVGDHHANILLYDRETHELERFDPYQASHYSYFTKILDTKLEKTFKIIDSLFCTSIQSPDPDFFRKQGLQLRSEMEHTHHAQDPAGFCQPWTILYADTRLSFPSQNPKTIVRYFEKLIRQKNDSSLTMFIRKYAESMHEMNQRIILEYETRIDEMTLFTDPRVSLLVLFLDRIRTYKNIYT
jgi:hypothetical protein